MPWEDDVLLGKKFYSQLQVRMGGWYEPPWFQLLANNQHLQDSRCSIGRDPFLTINLFRVKFVTENDRVFPFYML